MHKHYIPPRQTGEAIAVRSTKANVSLSACWDL
jgi:hypothetical protein